jgi:CRP-like cAMP-binding protein
MLAVHGSMAMNQAELLSSVRLRLNEAARRSSPQPGYVVMRAAGGSRRLVLTAAQAGVLASFGAEAVTVPEVLVRLINTHACPPLREYYELVLQAHAAGLLVSGTEPADRSLARRWRLRLPPTGTKRAVLTVMVLAAVALAVGHWVPPADWREVVAGWLAACLLRSAGQALAAGVLRGGDCEVRRPQFCWRSLFPHFRVEGEEAVMGGRDCATSVAALGVALPLLGAAIAAWVRPGWLAPLLVAVLVEARPWGRGVARLWLEAARRSPRLSVRSATVFDLNRRDPLARWAAWWSGTESRAGAGWLVWLGAWVALFAATAVRCGPKTTLAVVGRLSASGEGRSLVAAGLYALAALATIGVVQLVRAVVRHLRLRRELGRPLRSTVARLGPGGALGSDAAQALRAVPLFQDVPEDDLAALAAAVQPVAVKRNDFVFRENDPGHDFFIVREGEFEVLKLRPGSTKRTNLIGCLGPGDAFGEIALLENCQRTAAVRSRTGGWVWRLAKDDFNRLVVGRVGAARVREVLQSATFLGRMVFFAGWPPDDLLNFARRCRPVRIEAGATVLRQGQPNLWFHLVYDGALEERDGDRVVRRLGPGDYFGEIDLLVDSEARLSVTASEESRCLALSRKDFLELFARDYRLGLRMETLASRLRGGQVFASH